MKSSTSRAKIQANRSNALRSTGPRTVEGKRRSSMNAVRHGALSEAPVIAHMESEEEWLAHRGAVFDALEPSNHVEDFLVERIALQAWRLVRLARYESERLSLLQENVDRDVNDYWLRVHRDLGWPAQAREAVEFLEEGDASVGEFLNAIEQNALGTVSGETASWVLELAGEASGLEGWDELCASAWQDRGDPVEFRWDGPLAWEYVQIIADAADEDPMNLLAKARSKATMQRLRAVQKSAAIDRRVAKMRVNHLQLGAAGQQTLARYESHLERSFYRTLREYQRLQERRVGMGV